MIMGATAITMITLDLCTVSALPRHTGSDASEGHDGRSEPLLMLLTFLSPAFPVGAFSYSHGLEQVIDSGAIRDPGALQTWLTDLLRVGSGWTDAVLFAEAYQAAASADVPRLHAVAELASALSPSRERHLEATAQGRAFLDAISASWPCVSAQSLLDGGGSTYCVAVAAVAADHGIALETALPAFLNAFITNLVSVGVRLIPIGQNAGLKILSALHPLIAETAGRAVRSTLEDLGSATIVSDIASMRHEEQYSRVFRT
jgi:urease accessory protein